MLVSIIIPVYNAEHWLAESIESALRQTHEQKEVIVVDDGSTDNSFAIAEQFEKDGVIVIRQPNAGAAVARNTGMALAKGEFFQFLDAGDLLSEDKIQKQVKVLEGQPCKLAVCNYLQFANTKNLQQSLYTDQSHFIYSSNQPLDFLVNLWGGNGESNFIQTNCWLVPRTLIENAGYWRSYRCPDDDGEFFARIILASEGIVYVPGVYNYYRIGGGGNQLSSNNNRKYLMNTLLTIDLKYRYLLQKGDHPGIRKAMAKQYFDFAVYRYPQNLVLSKLALKRYQRIGIKADVPLLGGILVECARKIFGWRTTRLLQYYLRERKPVLSNAEG